MSTAWNPIEFGKRLLACGTIIEVIICRSSCRPSRRAVLLRVDWNEISVRTWHAWRLGIPCIYPEISFGDRWSGDVIKFVRPFCPAPSVYNNFGFSLYSDWPQSSTQTHVSTPAVYQGQRYYIGRTTRLWDHPRERKRLGSYSHGPVVLTTYIKKKKKTIIRSPFRSWAKRF